MKTLIPQALFAGACLSLGALGVCAQLVVSNLGETSDSFPFTSGNVWRADSFTTDNQGYTLDSVTLSLGPVSSVGSVTPRVFADGGAAPAGSELETFPSQTVTSSGNYTFDSSGLSLSASTTYWIVLQGSNPNHTSWTSTSSDNQTSTGSWTIGDVMLRSNNSGGSWGTTDTFSGQFSVNATPIPEPQACAAVTAFLLAGFALARWRFRHPHRI